MAGDFARELTGAPSDGDAVGVAEPAGAARRGVVVT